MLAMRQKDASKGIDDLPLVDILYLDWLEPFVENRNGILIQISFRN